MRYCTAYQCKKICITASLFSILSTDTTTDRSEGYETGIFFSPVNRADFETIFHILNALPDFF
jgi:hypothetical protein